MSVRNRSAIVGVGETEFSRNAGRSNLRLALEAITAALDDAGLAPRDDQVLEQRLHLVPLARRIAEGHDRNDPVL